MVGCCLSCIGVYVSVEHHWILLFDLNMLRTCTYGTLEYHILCQCTHLLYVLLHVYQPSLIREASHFHQDQYIYLLLKVRVHNIATILNTVVVVY